MATEEKSIFKSHRRKTADFINVPDQMKVYQTLGLNNRLETSFGQSKQSSPKNGRNTQMQNDDSLLTQSRLGSTAGSMNARDGPLVQNSEQRMMTSCPTTRSRSTLLRLVTAR